MLYDSPCVFSIHQIQEYYKRQVPAYFYLPKNKDKSIRVYLTQLYEIIGYYCRLVQTQSFPEKEYGTHMLRYPHGS